MSDLVGNPEDQFSRVVAHLYNSFHWKRMSTDVASCILSQHEIQVVLSHSISMVFILISTHAPISAHPCCFRNYMRKCTLFD